MESVILRNVLFLLYAGTSFDGLNVVGAEDIGLFLREQIVVALAPNVVSQILPPPLIQIILR